MDRQSSNQYLKALVEKRGYLLKSKKEKSKLLDEYCKTTGQNRNYVIRKIMRGAYLRTSFGQRKRKVYYDGYVKEVLIQVGESLIPPCGQRLEAILKTDIVKKLKANWLFNKIHDIKR